jgi:hypothetical protein
MAAETGPPPPPAAAKSSLWLRNPITRPEVIPAELRHLARVCHGPPTVRSKVVTIQTGPPTLAAAKHSRRLCNSTKTRRRDPCPTRLDPCPSPTAHCLRYPPQRPGHHTRLRPIPTSQARHPPPRPTYLWPPAARIVAPPRRNTPLPPAAHRPAGTTGMRIAASTDRPPRPRDQLPYPVRHGIDWQRPPRTPRERSFSAAQCANCDDSRPFRQVARYFSLPSVPSVGQSRCRRSWTSAVV